MDLMADGYSAVIKRFEDGASPPVEQKADGMEWLTAID